MQLTVLFFFDFLVLFTLICLFSILLKKGYGFGRKLSSLVLVVYLFILFMLTLFPSGMDYSNFQPPHQILLLVNLSISDLFHDSLYQIFGNTFLLMPLVFLLALLNQKLSSLKAMVLIAFGVSFFIETTQLFMTYYKLSMRVCDINDLILNTLGAFIGFALFRLAERIFPQVMEFLKK